MKYKVEGGTAEFGADTILKLTKEQAASRMHSLEVVKDGYRPTRVVQFKAGEVVDVDRIPAQLNGKLGTVLVPAGSTETVARRRAARKPIAKAKPKA